MKLVKIRIKGFQSFHDSGDITFSEKINIVVGQNNSGKSALLRALLPTLPDDRHRTSTKWQEFRLPRPEVFFTLEVSGAEIRDWVLIDGGQQYFPVGMSDNRLTVAFIEELFKFQRLELSVSRTPGNTFHSVYPSHRLFTYVPGSQQIAAAATPNNGEIIVSNHGVSSNDSLPGLLFNAWNRVMFYFAAERMTIGEAGPGYGSRLEPNASNLPNVLHTLNSERGDVFKQLVDHLREIFQSVGNLSVRTRPGSHNLEIRVWPTEAMERVELSFPLNSSGTGVAQVIALLAAIMTIDDGYICNR
ncbi:MULTISPECIES: AAA family ATPase [unclassified Mesorhizobium]|uniref:AAA family ATPase n=1 Tax=unclassified Mesorhizobium TaxID=325217 RepID=UPI000FD95471|nr:MULTISPECIES: AAA family ATPase [unclassified Mesorhizobium]TGT68014.1 hypothetical protein EN809_026180 [Mesorhizobium sp. M2E.F.Ca.ET.166.01.1.1]TGW01015.1 hypothetical protein EN797_011490 [Mesorhizobium sp. M2E.F.Ca.ET.154.01.1.1]